jgi:hypothetical protein
MELYRFNCLYSGDTLRTISTRNTSTVYIDFMFPVFVTEIDKVMDPFSSMEREEEGGERERDGGEREKVV